MHWDDVIVVNTLKKINPTVSSQAEGMITKTVVKSAKYYGLESGELNNEEKCHEFKNFDHHSDEARKPE